MNEHTIIIEFKNKRPLDVADFAASLSAVSDQFKRTVADEGGVDAEARLFIHQIRPGSVVAELMALGKSAGDLYDSYEKISSFAGAIYEVMQSILHLRPEAKNLDRPTIRNVAQILGPISVDAEGATFNMINNRGGTIVNHYTVTPMEASAIRHNANHLLNSQFPDEIRFENEPMVLFQMRNAPPGKSGDFGIIDRFSTKERKLTFASDAVKDAILHHDGNPFDHIFWVDGVVKTAGGAIASYVIIRLIDAQRGEG